MGGPSASSSRGGSEIVTRRLSLLFLPLLLCFGPAALAGSEAAREYELKAAYIYNFAKFTRWSAAGDSGVPWFEVTETLPEGLDYVTWQSGLIDLLAEALAR